MQDAGVSRRRLVQRAAEFLNSHAAEGVRIGELSRVAGVSERTLRKAFHTVHGLSPKQFDLRERLFGARRALCERRRHAQDGHDDRVRVRIFRAWTLLPGLQSRVWRVAVANHQDAHAVVRGAW